MYLKRKIDDFLIKWKEDINRKPLIVKGARQIGKTESIMHFANANYTSVIYINFALDKRFIKIAEDGYDVNTIVKNRNGEVSSCDIPYSRNLSEFNHNYLKLTKQVNPTYTAAFKER